MKKALVVSQNFNPGHASHLMASYKQLAEIGYEPIYFVDPQFKDFLPADSNMITAENKNIPTVEVAMILFPSLKNPGLIRKLSRKGTKIIYLFHEPLTALKEYKKAGFSWPYLAKLMVIDWINAYTVRKSGAIILPSRKAVQYYNANRKYKNSFTCCLPLMFDDEREARQENIAREYISYIGTVAADHSFDEFVNFVKEALKNDWFPDKKFMIATKSEFEVPAELMGHKRVKIIKGKPLSNSEINDAYASSALIWNAYTRTTQSGVMVKAFMFGTPALVLKNNLNEFMEPGKTVEVLGDNNNKREIKEAVEKILSNFEEYSRNCRQFFLNNFYYRKYNDKIKELIDLAGNGK